MWFNYGFRCGDCWAGGSLRDGRYVNTQPSCLIPFDEQVKMGRGLARNGQVVHSGRGHIAG